jgi:hypothetical protein
MPGECTAIFSVDEELISELTFIFPTRSFEQEAMLTDREA